MSLTLGLNISSIKAQRRLSENTSELSKVFERLSSGQRINRASDDAAGLAISESLRADSRVFNQGVRNLNDGISLLNIADGAIESLSKIVIRLSELAEQSANGSYNAEQRAALDLEAQALSDEYLRIAQSTEFNGVKLLDGSLGDGLRLQGGYGELGSIFSSIGGAIGTGTFQASASLATGSGSRSVETGDFNGDGVLDFVTADWSDGKVSVFLGNGDGSFQSRVSYQVGNNPESVGVGDFDGDGILDLVTADRADGKVSVLLGNGDGTFQMRTSYQAGAGVTSVAAADYNGDGVPDLATADNTDGKVSILIGNGDGTFQDRVSYQVGSTPKSVKAGDFNGDGILDLVSTNIGDDKVSVLIGNGDGTFQARVSYQIGGDSNSVQTADFNGDGILDLVTASYGESTLSILLGNGDGTFQARATYDTEASGPYAVQTGDVNGDGIVDLVTSDLGDQAISIFLGNGDGTFQEKISYSVGTGPSWLQIGDINNDGVSDIITVSQNNDVNLFTGDTQDGTGPLLPFDLSTLDGARQALPVFSQKIEQLAEQRGKIGAFLSRTEVANNVLKTSAENYTIAEGRIRNADIAVEAASLARLSILQNATVSVLAQANLQPSLVLTLLGKGRDFCCYLLDELKRGILFSVVSKVV